MTSATEHPELPTRVPGKAARIATVHMLGHWLADNDAPSVEDVTAQTVIGIADEVDEQTRFAAVRSFAERTGAEITEGAAYLYATAVIAERGDHGCRVVYTLFAERDKVAML